MKYLVSFLAIASFLVTSCSVTNNFENDDIYSVRASNLPLGESTTDELSYASYKTRKEGQYEERLAYSDDIAYENRQNCLNQWRWYDGCGCSYSDWSRYSRYSSFNNYGYISVQPNYYFYQSHPYGGYGVGFGYGMYYSWGYPYYHNPYLYSNPWYYNGWGYNPYRPYHYGYPYGNYGYNYGYGHSYGYGGYGYGGYGYGGYGYGGYGYGGYGNYGYNGVYGQGGYGYGGNSNGWSNSGTNASNVITSHRGSPSSGYYNPNGRTTSSNSVLSPKKPNTDNVKEPSGKSDKTFVKSGRTFEVKEVANSDLVFKLSKETINRNNASSTSQPERSNASTVINRNIDNLNKGIENSVNGNATNTTIDRSRTNPTNSSVDKSRTSSPNTDYYRTYPDRNVAPSNTTPSNSRGNSSNYREIPSGNRTTTSPSREPAYRAPSNSGSFERRTPSSSPSNSSRSTSESGSRSFSGSSNSNGGRR